MSDGFITIHLHGHLKQHLSEPLRVKAKTLRQALTALQTVDAFNPHKTRRKIPVRVDHFSTPAQLDDTWGRDEVHLRPEPGFAGAGGGDWLRVVVGVTLIVVGILLSPFTGGASLTATAVGGSMLATVAVATLSVLVTMAGSYYLMTGLQGLLYDKPTAPAPQEQKRSYFGNYQATVQAGTPIPIILGCHKWSGHLISYAMDVKPGTNGELPVMENRGGWSYLQDNTTPPSDFTFNWQQINQAFTS
ncbi:hypothetical protein PU634_10270 [Oceanimonas pelagia]|uniref:Tail assembly protein n=1 Tax=Oceanimonas pelagia TaxID=3028314 RepID=A0AA50KM50_9GAMM|nr:hypothetical protein [Oceanimonas pelagia]WMC09500.1 hypothetical protein PU634_10270 [Oceanimonas pelagia]